MNWSSQVQGVWRHLFWADREIVGAVAGQSGSSPEAVREAAHVFGAEEIWLARIEGRQPRAVVWPEVGVGDLTELMETTHTTGRLLLARLVEEDLDRPVHYTNSAGTEFTSTVGDILVHVALHGQYHRGKVNLLLRQAGLEPAPVDYIAWLRGAPAATEADAARGGQGDIE